MSIKPIALEAYEALAEAYASVVNTKPHNAYYERPATFSLLPEIKGKKVLDAGCGPGVYSEWLIERGAEIVAVDASARMIELTQRRLKRTTDIWQADLGQPLTFLESSNFDVVLSPLVLNYIQDWTIPLAEFHRVLRPGGYFVFSVSHPFSDYTYFKSNNYFETELVGSEWQGFEGLKVHMPSYRRSLQSIINPLIAARFRVDKILEPKPTAEFKQADPITYRELMQQPVFLCIRARRE